MATLRNRLKLWNHYVRDISGVAAIEFALILPILFALFLGVAEYARMTMYARRVNQVTAMLSDLVAREEQINDAGFNGIEDGIRTAWKPFDNVDNLQFLIRSVRRASDLATKVPRGSAYVEWSKQLMGAQTVPKCSPYVLPVPDMIAKGNSMISVTGYYTYNTLLGVVVPSIGLTTTAFPWEFNTNHSPRNSVCVVYDNVSCSQTNCE
jgi:Flp pilus assembly protein TadG